MIYYIGIGINVFLLLILVAKKGKSFADNILAAWLFIIALHTFSFVLTLQPVNINNIHFMMGLSAPFPLIHGPFLYLYTAASTNMFPSKKKVWLLHFIPFLLAIIFFTPLYLKSGQEKMDIYMNGGADYRLINFILVKSIQFSGVIYIVWSFILLNKHKKNIGQQFSYEEKINLNWLRYLIYGLLVIWIIIIVLKKSSLIFGGGVVFITLLGFLGIRQVGIFGKNQVPIEGEEEIETELVPNETEPAYKVKNVSVKLPQMNHSDEVPQFEEKETVIEKRKYSSSGLTSETGKDIHERLRQLMETEKVYTEPELSLAMLAARLKIHPNYLSQVINEKEGKSFFDYINNLRVEEFKRLVSLTGSSQYTIISLAYDCGFNSKSSFNKNFKKVTGLSPSEYLNGTTEKS
jgi:AraC-like DNA-binding protein